MRWSARKIVGISLIVFFSIIFVIAFVIYPDIGEKILYGKHPPGKEEEEVLGYSEIILSKNYDCMETASTEAKGDLSKFVKEFNNCNG